MFGYNTKIWRVDKIVGDPADYPQIQEAAEQIRAKEAVAFPTETVYGLGADATSSEAVKKIFAAKGRPGDNPLIVHIADMGQLEELTGPVDERSQRLMQAFWPGPLTLILPARSGIAPEVTAGLSTVGIRMPDHPLALALIRCAQTPLAAPSANRSGRPSPTTAAHVAEDLDGKIAGILDGGPTGVGVESTVLDVTGEVVVILRPGGVTREQLEEVIGPVDIDPGLLAEHETQRPKAPGMKYRHYAPKGEMWIVEAPTSDRQAELIRDLIGQARGKGLKTGVLATEENAGAYPQADFVITCGSRLDPAEAARKLYNALRAFDEQQVDYILAESFPEQGMGLAVMNRLRKAAGHRVYTG